MQDIAYKSFICMVEPSQPLGLRARDICMGRDGGGNGPRRHPELGGRGGGGTAGLSLEAIGGHIIFIPLLMNIVHARSLLQIYSPLGTKYLVKSPVFSVIYMISREYD